MIPVRVATVDVYLVRQASSGLDVLVMRRARGVRCTGAWEVVHGRIESGERPEDTALREVSEETGLHVDRLYNVTCLPFYLHKQGIVNVAVVFAAFVTAADVRLGPEHDASEWLPASQAADRIAWPRARDMLRDILQLVGQGNAGPLEDVLRVR
ncbi:MAG: NUDIX domain-containing protein [Gemmatimonadaceae bacterium]